LSPFRHEEARSRHAFRANALTVVRCTDDNSAFIDADLLEPVEFRGDIWMTLLLIINAPERSNRWNAILVITKLRRSENLVIVVAA
jgi:hypothetical protein